MDKPLDPPLDFYKPRLQPDDPTPPPPDASVLGNSHHPPHLMDSHIDDSKLVGVPVAGPLLPADSSPAAKLNAKFKDKVLVVDKTLGIRRRGRPPRGQVKPPRYRRDKRRMRRMCVLYALMVAALFSVIAGEWTLFVQICCVACRKFRGR